MKGKRIGHLLAITAVLALAACGSKVSGTYTGPGMNLEFKSGGKVVQTVMGMEVEMKYEVEDNKVKLITPSGNLVLTLQEDGSIKGPMGIRLEKKK